MKTILATALLSLSLNVMAFEQRAILDFSNLYGNTNAGVYEMTAELTPKKTLSESALSYSTRQDDGQFSCTTTASFEIGEMNFTLKNIKDGKIINIKNQVFAGVSKTTDGYDCDSTIEDLAGEQVVYSQIGPKGPIALDVVAPFDYKSVGVYLAPFNGYLNLPVNVKIAGDKLVINPSKLLTEKLILDNNTQNSSVTYYVFAQKDATTLSLGTGLIKFER